MHTMVAEMQESQGNRFVLRYHYGEVECRKEWQKLGCEPSFIETMSLGGKNKPLVWEVLTYHNYTFNLTIFLKLETPQLFLMGDDPFPILWLLFHEIWESF